MFVVSAKLSPVKLLAISAAVCTLVLGAVFLALPNDKAASASVSETAGSTRAANAEEVRTFLSSSGWETAASGKEEKVTIPSEWNATFENYNTVQKLQGFDLKKYRGKEVTRFSFEVTNYPDENEVVYANVLTFKGRVIGGDLSTARADGYMHGFALPDDLTSAAGLSSETEAAMNEPESEMIPEK